MNRKQRINNLLLNHLKEFSIEILDNSHLHINHNNFDGTGETHIKIVLEKRKEVKFDRSIPLWFHRIIQSYNLRRESISKFVLGMCYSKQGEETSD